MVENNGTIRTDNPINKKSDDTLGRSGFAEAIGKAMGRYRGSDSLVVGMYGEWGAGKTSVINMVLEAINDQDYDKNSEPIIVHFCPWYFSGQDQLFEQFFKQLAYEIQEKVDDTGKMIGNLLLTFGSILEVANKAANVAGIPYSEERKGITNCIKNIIKRRRGENEEKVFNPIKLKNEISSELKKLKRKVIIVIDDIDRLTKKEIRQIFQLVKALADFPNTVYFLSFDKEIVCGALESGQSGNASKYLEKIIQIPFELPGMPTEPLRQHLISNLYKIVSEDFDEKLRSHWSSIYSRGLKHYFSNFREINRFLNLFQCDYSLLRNEVNIVDLIALTAIKSQDSRLYQFIHHNKELFTYSSADFSSQAGKESPKDSYMKKRDSFNKINIIEPMLEEIFPHFSQMLGDYSVESGGDYGHLKQDKRIAHPDYFDRIYRLSVPEGQIPNTKLQEIIAMQDNPEHFSAAIQGYDYNNQCTLIGLFSDNLDLFEDKNLISIAKVVATIAENEDEEDTPILKPELSLSAIYFIGDLFKKNAASVKIQFERYKELFSDEAIGPYKLAGLLNTIARDIGARGQDGNVVREVIEKSEFKNSYFELEDIMLARLKKLKESGELQKHHKMIRLLYVWDRARPGEPQKYVEELLATDKGVIDFVTSFLTYSYGGDGRIPHVEKRYVDNFTDDSELGNKVKKIKDSDSYSDLPDKSKEAIEALLRRIDNPDEHDW